ncbi:hypothetical protein YC2023_050785 [Brassica napus]
MYLIRCASFSAINLGFFCGRGEQVLLFRKAFGKRVLRNRELVSLHFLWRRVAARFSIFSRTVAFA